MFFAIIARSRGGAVSLSRDSASVITAKAANERLPLPHIEELIEFGEITVDNKYPVGGVAVASDEHNALAMLVRRDGETLAQLLTRLDDAIGKALDEDIYTDEINPST